MTVFYVQKARTAPEKVLWCVKDVRKEHGL